jgi:hypothetical protein
MRRNDDELTETNLKLDQELLNELKRLGVVQHQYGLSRLCGMGRSYYSCMRTKRLGLKLGSLTFLSIRLGSWIEVCQNPRVAAVLGHAQRLVQNTIEAKCRLREQGLWRRVATPQGPRRLGGQSHAD